MDLSSDLISQLVKVTKNDKQTNSEISVYGTVVKYGNKKYVKLDGSDLLTPVTSTTAINDKDRVIVTIKNHAATVTGNVTDPSASSKDVIEIGDQIADFEIVIADKVSTKEFDAQVGRIDELVSDSILVKDKLTANSADIDELKAKNVEITGELSANKAEIDDLKAKKLDAEIADIKYATIEKLEATDANIHNLEVDYGEFKKLSTEKMEATDAVIENLDANYANIDFSNIGKAAIEQFYATSGIIKDLVIGDQTITGELVGVTIKGDLIKGNTIVADKLVIKGSDGLYYKLNTDGMTAETEQTEYNSLNGSVIQAKSITASKIDVKDLVAFDATIGGFKIDEKSIYSGVKESVDNTTRGIYLDNDGQIAIGDSKNFIKYYKDTDGLYKFVISAQKIIFGATSEDLESTLEQVVKDIIVEYAMSDSKTIPPETGWGIVRPNWVDGKYIWQRTKTRYVNGNHKYSDATCITGANGKDAILLQILSSNGNIFKNSAVSTTLTVEIIFGGVRILNSSEMKEVFGTESRIIWKQRKYGEVDYTDIAPTDPRLSDNGFIFTINTEDVKMQTVYNCILDY